MHNLKKTILSLTTTNKKGYAEGQFRNCRWRCFGPDCDSDARGQLHLANDEEFDRWANSVMIRINCDLLIKESKSLNSTLVHLMMVFD